MENKELVIRNWDNWNRYLDNQGKILHGKFEFLYKDSVTLGDIYDSDKTSLDNPIFTDIEGRTAIQVFLNQEKDYLVRAWKYIGKGTMETDTDMRNWEEQWTSESINESTLDIKVDAVSSINTMTDLQTVKLEDVPEVDGERVVELLGYYELGDCEPVYYRWDPECTDDHDFGAIIKSENYLTGRWVMITPSCHIDGRHYGIFPKESENSSTDHTTRINKLIDYCNKVGLHPLLQGTENEPYFFLNNTTIDSNMDIQVNTYTRFVCTNDVTINANHIDGNDTILCIKKSGSVVINADEAWTSWCYSGQINAKDTIHINSSQLGRHTYTNMRVYIETNGVANQTFNNCELFSSGKIYYGNYFENMSLKESQFASDADYDRMEIDDTVTLDIKDWPNTNNWIIMKCKQTNDTNWGDMQGRTITADAPITLTELSISNAVLADSKFDTVHYLTLNDCTGTIDSANNAVTVNINNCTIAAKARFSAPNININNSTFTNAISVSNTLDIKYSKITSCAAARLIMSYSSSTGTCTGQEVDISNCELYGLNIMLATSMRVTVRNNTFANPIKFTNEYSIGDNSAKVVKGIFINNYCTSTTATNFINWNGMKSKFIADDSQHKYTYSGNTMTSSNHEIFSYYTNHYNSPEWGFSDSDYNEKVTKFNQEAWHATANNCLSVVTINSYTMVLDQKVETKVTSTYVAEHTYFKVNMFAFGTYNLGKRRFKIAPVSPMTPTENATSAVIGSIASNSQEIKTAGLPFRNVPVWINGAETTVNCQEIGWDPDSEHYFLYPLYNIVDNSYLNTTLYHVPACKFDQTIGPDWTASWTYNVQAFEIDNI